MNKKFKLVYTLATLAALYLLDLYTCIIAGFVTSFGIQQFLFHTEPSFTWWLEPPLIFFFYLHQEGVFYRWYGAMK